MVKFSRLGITEFKTLQGCSSLEVVKNPNTEKLFGSLSNGLKIKAQQSFDPALPAEILVIEEDDIIEYCLVNKGTDNVICSL